MIKPIVWWRAQCIPIKYYLYSLTLNFHEITKNCVFPITLFPLPPQGQFRPKHSLILSTMNFSLQRFCLLSFIWLGKKNNNAHHHRFYMLSIESKIKNKTNQLVKIWQKLNFCVISFACKSVYIFCFLFSIHKNKYRCDTY